MRSNGEELRPAISHLASGNAFTRYSWYFTKAKNNTLITAVSSGSFLKSSII